MDDLEFRRRAYAEPDNEDPDFLHKKSQSEENGRFVDELKAFDDSLRVAMQVEPPEGLAERIKLNQALGAHADNKQRYRSLLSLAASVLVVIGISVGVMRYTPEHDLSAQLLTHVYDELYHLDDNFNYSMERTNQVLAAQGLHLAADVAPVRYVGKCEIDQQDGVHMVLQGQKGPVTVMLMPHRQVGARIAIADQRFHGSIEPMARGSLAIIAEQGEPVDELRRSLHNGLQWRF